MQAPPSELADRDADVEVSPGEVLVHSFRDYVRHRVTMRMGEGEPVTVHRELLRTGRVVVVLPVDLARGEVVLIRQFRLAAHLTLGLGDMVETVAGYVEPGESPSAAAERECLEEIGVRPQALVELMSYMPDAGLNDETVTLFLAAVDVARVPERAGAADEMEHTRPLRLTIDTAIAALGQNTMHNGHLIIALQWLALNRGRLAEIAGAGKPAAP